MVYWRRSIRVSRN